MILDELNVISGNWTKWIDFVEKDPGVSLLVKGGGRAIADSVIKFCGSRLPAHGVSRLRYICDLFGVEVKLAVDLARDIGYDELPESGIAEVCVRPDRLFDDGSSHARILLGWYRKRKKNVFAHEVGHFFCAAIWELATALRIEGVPDSEEDMEQSCWIFAAELMCPRTSRQGWTAGYIRTLEDVLHGTSEHDVVLTVGRLYAIARTNRISVRTVFCALNHLPLLLELKECVAILSMKPNENTGDVPALRTTMTALPSTLFIPTNRRAQHHGFLEAPQVYDNAPVNEYCLAEETVLMRTKEPQSRKWSADFIGFPSRVIYVPVVWGGERQLAVTWKYVGHVPPISET